MHISRRVISAAVFFSAVVIYVSSSSPSPSPSPSETVVNDSISTNLPKTCFGDYCIGDPGPGGGIIVHIDIYGFGYTPSDNRSIGSMCLTGTCNYLEMAPADLTGQYSWQSAIAAAEQYSTPSANDWKLPSLFALNAMCKFAFGEPSRVDESLPVCKKNPNGTDATGLRFGGFSADDFYWSSSEEDDGTALVQTFYFNIGTDDLGLAGANFKYRLSYVRPVRAF